MTDMAKTMSQCVELGKAYLISKIINGLCFEFHQMQHGPSWAWTTACVGSTLSEFGFVSQEMLEVILSLQCKNGGWGYNPKVFSDADTTLRVIQFLKKIRFRDKTILERAERFVVSHQLSDGGFATYLSEAAESTGYKNCSGWCSSHPCNTILAINILSDQSVIAKADEYMSQRLSKSNFNSYWWRTPYYVRYEMGLPNGPPQSNDPVELGLALLLKSKRGVYDPTSTRKLISLQTDNGSFPPSSQFRIPDSNKSVGDNIDEGERILYDYQGIFSTCAAIVAIERQKHFA